MLLVAAELTRIRVGFADCSIQKVLEKFCGQNLTTKSDHKNGDKRLNMYLIFRGNVRLAVLDCTH